MTQMYADVIWREAEASLSISLAVGAFAEVSGVHAGQHLPMPQASREHSGENRVAEQTPLAEAGDLVSKAHCGPGPSGTTCSHLS